MSSIDATSGCTGSRELWMLAKERTVAGHAFNRWLVPPAALAIHLCIGMAYVFSVFWLPMSKLLANPDATCPKSSRWTTDLFTTHCNWSVASEEAEKHQMSDEELQAGRRLAHEVIADPQAASAAQGTFGAGTMLARLAVGVPFGW